MVPGWLARTRTVNEHYLLGFLAAEPFTTIEGASLPGRDSEVDMAVLVHLALECPKIVSATALMQTAYGDTDPDLFKQGLQNAMSRLRLPENNNLPIPRRTYKLDIDPLRIDILDYNTRATRLIDQAQDPSRLTADAVQDQLDKIEELDHLWSHDPAAHFADQPRVAKLFSVFQRRRRRLLEKRTILLARSGRAADAAAELESLEAEFPDHDWTTLHTELDQVRPIVVPTSPSASAQAAATATSESQPANEAIPAVPLDNLAPASYGRFAPRAAFDGLLRGVEGHHRVTQLYGLGGQGKSSLAHYLAWAFRGGRVPQFLDGTEPQVEPFNAVVWISDKDAPGSLTLEQVLSTVTRALDYHGDSASTIEQRQDMVQRILHHHHTFLVLDNCETIADSTIFDWIESAIPDRTRVLLTSREPVESLRERSTLVLLEGMTGPEATPFLHELCRHLGLPVPTDQDIEELVEVTGGNPMALQLGLGLAARSGEPIFDVLARVVNDPSVLLADLFARSWSSVSEQARHVLTAAALLGPVTDRELLSRVSGIEDQPVLVAAIIELADLALLTVQRQASLRSQALYRVHPLVVEFVQAQLADSDAAALGEATRERWLGTAVDLAEAVGFCVDHLDRLNTLDVPGRSDYVARAAWWAHDHGLHDEAIRIARESRYYFYVRGLWQLSSLQLARAASARDLKHWKEELDAITYHLNVEAKRGATPDPDLLERMEYLSQLASLDGYSTTEARHVHALFHLQDGNYKEAETIWTSNLRSFEGRQPQFVNSAEVNANLRWLATCLIRSGRPSEAAPVLQRAADQATEHGFVRALVSVELELAEICLWSEQGDIDQAKDHLRRAQEVMSMVDDLYYKAQHALLLGEALAQSGEHLAEARRQADLAYSLFTRLGHAKADGEALGLVMRLSEASDDA